MKNITLIPQRIGQKKLGIEKTPNIIKQKLLNYNNLKFHNINLSNNYNNFFSDMKYIYNVNSTNLVNNKLNINIGGDHSISIGTVAASIEKYKENLLVFWIDAHADINSYESSITKNFHGMPLHYLTNCKDYTYESWLFDNQLNYDKLFYFGIRDIDNYENDIIEKNKIFNFSIQKYNKINNFNDHFNHIKNIIKNKKIHLSIDVDGIDPSFIQCTGTPVKNGLHINYVLNLINVLKNNIVNIDFVELNLDLEQNFKENSLKHSLMIINKLIK